VLNHQSLRSRLSKSQSLDEPVEGGLVDSGEFPGRCLDHRVLAALRAFSERCLAVIASFFARVSLAQSMSLWS
jgi:hypothetical protein